MRGPVGDAGGEPVGSRPHDSTSFGMQPRDRFGSGDCSEDGDGSMALTASDRTDMLENAPSGSFVEPGRGVMGGKMEEARGTSVVGGPSSRGAARAGSVGTDETVSRATSLFSTRGSSSSAQALWMMTTTSRGFESLSRQPGATQ